MCCVSRCAGAQVCWVSRCAGVQVCWGWTSVSSIVNSLTAKHKLQGRTVPATPSPGPPLAHLCAGESPHAALTCTHTYTIRHTSSLLAGT